MKPSVLSCTTDYFSVPNPCQLIEYDSIMTHSGTREMFTTVTLSHQPLAHVEHKEDFMFSFNAFLSAVGGNLGLFLGFSLLSTMFDLLDLTGRITKMIKIRKHKQFNHKYPIDI